MDWFMVILRLVHILAAFAWVGGGFFMVAVYSRTFKHLSKEQIANMDYRIYALSPFNIIMPAGSILTTLAGVILYIRVTGNFNADWFRDTGNIILTIGAIAGLAAFGHGFALGKKSGEYTEMLKSSVDESGKIAEDKIDSINAASKKLISSAQISFILMVIAVIGMSAARYL